MDCCLVCSYDTFKELKLEKNSFGLVSLTFGIKLSDITQKAQLPKWCGFLQKSLNLTWLLLPVIGFIFTVGIKLNFDSHLRKNDMGYACKTFKMRLEEYLSKTLFIEIWRKNTLCCINGYP
jgi:hypothetical protein